MTRGLLKRWRVLLPVFLALLVTLTVIFPGFSRGGKGTPVPATLIPVMKEATPIPVIAGEADVAFAQNERLGRGINLGNALEAPNEGEWGVTLKEEYFDRVQEGGFDSVRIPINWSTHAEAKPPYTIDPAFFHRIDWAVDQALSRGLTVMINIHHYEEMNTAPEAHRERFLALWAQIAEHYQGYPDDLVFELLNEPYNKMTADIWNPLLREAIATIRETNPSRVLVVGPAFWNTIDGMMDLRLPEDDRRLIVTFHYYIPFEFTHQGASWAGEYAGRVGTKWTGTAEEREEIARDLDRAAAWAEAHGRPLHMGEFGVYDKADIESRAHWTEFVAREAEARGMSWSYWEFCSGFGVFDSARQQWNQPLIEALLPDA